MLPDWVKVGTKVKDADGKGQISALYLADGRQRVQISWEPDSELVGYYIERFISLVQEGEIVIIFDPIESLLEVIDDAP